MGRKLTTEEVVDRFKKANGVGSFDYSEVVYINNRTKIKVFCAKHQQWFYPLPETHWKNGGSGCEECRREKVGSAHRRSLDEFIREAEEIHGKETYDYSLVKYVNAITKVKIRCVKHNHIFQQIPQSHLAQKVGCDICATEKISTAKRLNTTIFIERAEKVHGVGVYDYSKVNYIDSKTPVIVICPKHGEFYPAPNNFWSGKGCFWCGIESNVKKRTKSQAYFLSKVVEVHPQYDFSKFVYTGRKYKSVVICPIHGEFTISAGNLLSGFGCDKCGREKVSIANTKTQEQFLKDMTIIHPTYDFSKSIYKHNSIEVTVICPIHGEFEIAPKSLMNGSGCSICNKSLGEKSIREILEKHQLLFTEQQTFPECINLMVLPFDFYLENLNILIEYQGEQHYHPVQFGGISLEKAEENFKDQQIRDNIKRKFCQDNGIFLLEIPYWQFDKIEYILEKTIRRE